MVGLTINGGSQTLDGTYNYDFVTITNSGILYVTPYNGTGTTGTLILNVTGDVSVDTTSSINGTARGYLGTNAGRAPGTGPGAGGWGVKSVTNGGGGGGGSGYGTSGGAGSAAHAANGGGAGGSGGGTYGTTSGTDIGMGSGGGSSGNDQSVTMGQPGGAMLTINAQNIQITGTLTFKGGIGGGQSGNSWGAGGGASGGGIMLNARGNVNLNNATITTTGGVGGVACCGVLQGGTGGGGRLKVFGGTITTTGANITTGTVYYEITSGSTSFTSSPSNARIWIDGVDTGINTPNTVTTIPAGSHNYTLKLTGYQDTSGTFSVTAGQTTTVSLVTFPGSTYFTSNPTGATIWVDDVNTGKTTPNTVVGLADGSHTYRLIKIGYTNRGNFSATVGTTTNVSATLTAVGLNGSIWIEDQYLCFINSSNVATYIN